MSTHPPWCADAGPSLEAQAQHVQNAQCNAQVQPGMVQAELPAAQNNHTTTIQIDSITYEMPGHFKFLKRLGRGTYGSVAAFRDTVLERDVAIKKVPNPFRNAIDGKRILREIKLLRLLSHDSIIGLLDVLPPPGPDFEEVYLVTELMDADLHTVINSEEPLSDDHVQFFVYQILRSLLYLHSANVVHRDLKPLNVLVNQNCDIKLCDFGLARGRAGFSQEDDDFLRTEYVGTRWYRAPEVVLTSMEYTAAIDIWSVGCITCELLGQAPIFRGTDFLDQIRTICEVLGTPLDDELSFIPPQNEAARTFIKTRFPGLKRKDWASLYPNANSLALNLVDRMLQFDPNRRITAYDALRHEYLADHHAEEEEPLAPEHLDWKFDDGQPDVNRLRRLVYFEAVEFHPEIVQRDRLLLTQKGWLEDLPGDAGAQDLQGQLGRLSVDDGIQQAQAS